MQKFRVGRVGRNKSSPWLWNMASAAAISSGGNPNFGHASTARMHQALMDGEKDQRLVARGREKAGNQHIGIDDRPDHFTPPGVTGSTVGSVDLQRMTRGQEVSASGGEEIAASE